MIRSREHLRCINEQQKRQIHCDLVYKYVETSYKRKIRPQTEQWLPGAGGEGIIAMYRLSVLRQIPVPGVQRGSCRRGHCHDAGHSLREPIFSLHSQRRHMKSLR